MKNRTHDIYTILGASNHSISDRSQNDFYATPPSAVKRLIELETFSDKIWEPACGMGHIAKEFELIGKDVKKTDIDDYGYDGCISGVDFLNTNIKFDGDIITNPPYNISTEFVKHAIETVTDGHKVAMFLKIQFLETQKRYKEIFKTYPPKVIYVSVKRYGCKSDGDFSNGEPGSAVCYCWFVWEKGFTGDPVVKWFNY